MVAGTRNSFIRRTAFDLQFGNRDVGGDSGYDGLELIAVWRTRPVLFVFGGIVSVTVKEPDRYRQLVARVIVDGKDVSAELVKAWLAWHFKTYSSDAELSGLETKAREARVGIW